MKIPAQYIGTWRGLVDDRRLANPYTGEIILSADHVETSYLMARGTQRGRLGDGFESDGFLALKETVNSWSGTLMLYLDAKDQLRCVWRSRTKCDSEATMTRCPLLETSVED